MRARRRYTPQEATALVGPLEALLAELREARAVLSDRELSGRLGASAPGNGGGADGTTFAGAAMRFSRGVTQLERWGVILRDLDTGLCDFPAERGGREVFLCWRSGELAVEWWHEPEAGFRGRRRLDEDG